MTKDVGGSSRSLFTGTPESENGTTERIAAPIYPERIRIAAADGAERKIDVHAEYARDKCREHKTDGEHIFSRFINVFTLLLTTLAHASIIEERMFA